MYKHTHTHMCNVLQFWCQQTVLNKLSWCCGYLIRYGVQTDCINLNVFNIKSFTYVLMNFCDTHLFTPIKMLLKRWCSIKLPCSGSFHRGWNILFNENKNINVTNFNRFFPLLPLEKKVPTYGKRPFKKSNFLTFIL